MLRKWNVVLVVLSFLLAIFGTFITRSGVIQSVHSFAQSPVGTWFGTFFFIATGTTIYLVATRLRDLEAKAELESMVSREAAFLYNNLVLIGIAFAVLWGTLFPILSEWVRGDKITVGPPFFNAVNIPLGFVLIFLTGVGPLIAWRRASVGNLKRQFIAPVATGIAVGVVLFALGMRSWHALIAYTLCGFVAGTIFQEFRKGIAARRTIHGENFATAFVRLVGRNRRRYGGYIVHAGVIMMFAAFAGLAFKKESDVTLRPGQAFVTKDPYNRTWRFVSQGVSISKDQNRLTTALALDVTRDGKPVGVMKTEKRQYFDATGQPIFEPSTEVGIHYSLRGDTYLVLAGVRGDAAELRVTFNPLVVWVWYGGMLMAIGGLIVMWPQAQKQRAQAGYVSVLTPASGQAELVGA